MLFQFDLLCLGYLNFIRIRKCCILIVPKNDYNSQLTGHGISLFAKAFVKDQSVLRASASAKIGLKGTDPKKSSLMLPIANILATSLLVPMILMRRCVPFSIT